MQILEYLDLSGRSPFAAWFDRLDAAAAAKIAIALTRLGQGNLSNVKGVGSGILEYRIDFGPGYRLYFGRDGEMLIILLGGVPNLVKAGTSRWRKYGGQITSGVSDKETLRWH
jgi:putative addiction module killer protein